MKKVLILLLTLSILATPSYALNLFDRIKYKEVRLENEMVLVNRFTGKVEQRFIRGRYEPIPSDRGFGGIPSLQDVYQARYDKSSR